MKTLEDIQNFIEERELEDVRIFTNPDFAPAFIGISSDNRAIYSYERMIQCIMDNDGVDAHEAMDDLDFNIMNALGQEEDPIVLVYEAE